MKEEAVTSLNNEEAKPGEEEISLGRRVLDVRTLASFLVAFVIIVLALTQLGVDWLSIWEQVRASNPWLYGIAFLLFYISLVVRGVRWRILLRNVGFRRRLGVSIPSAMGLTEIVFLSWFANCVVPAKLGDAYRAYLLKRRAAVSFSTTMGTIVAERIMDTSVVFILLGGVALWFVGRSGLQNVLILLGIGGGMMAVIALVLLIMGRFGAHIQGFLPKRLAPFYERFQAGTLGSFRQLPSIALLSVVVWFFEAGRLLFVSYSMGLSLALPFILFVALANSLLTVVPFTPGGLGLVEVGVVGLLMMVISKESAVSVAFLDRTISYWSLVILGLAFFPLRGRK
ncbi:MAG: flippase-like domain-containing protein [Chloroflexi bacterium]|nr:flippase-like domain-containing protein [Chloroflexota bacterium]